MALYLTVLLSVTVGCGAPDTDETPTPNGVAAVDSCADCAPVNAEIPDVEWHASARVYAYPDALTFYGDVDADRALPPRWFEVINSTPERIVVTTAYIVDNPTSLSGPGASAYFRLSGLSSPVALEPGERHRLHVAFVPTGEQREAYVVVEIHDGAATSLVVQLAGKYFVGDALGP